MARIRPRSPVGKPVMSGSRIKLGVAAAVCVLFAVLVLGPAGKTPATPSLLKPAEGVYTEEQAKLLAEAASTAAAAHAAADNQQQGQEGEAGAAVGGDEAAAVAGKVDYSDEELSEGDARLLHGGDHMGAEEEEEGEKEKEEVEITAEQQQQEEVQQQGEDGAGAGSAAAVDKPTGDGDSGGPSVKGGDAALQPGKAQSSGGVTHTGVFFQLEEGKQEELLVEPMPEDCFMEGHADYDGPSLSWGLTYKKASAAQCCQACKEQSLPKESGERCNVWVWCGSITGECWSPDIWNHTTGECWLKYQKDWDNSVDRAKSNLMVNARGPYPAEYRKIHGTTPETVQWTAGVLPALGTMRKQ